ncbi:MAG: glycosyltransferase, partial [Nocardioidaceae bacterium]|nr:glycosyltransferase [Nocardioidaceae bacterium]
MDAREGAFVARLATQLESEDSAAYAQFAVRTRSPLARGVLRAAGEHALLGQVLALSTDADGGRRGLALLDEAVAREGLQSLSSRGIALWADLLLRSGRDAELRSLLDERPADLSDLDRWKLRTDLVNPHRTSWDEDEASTAPAVTGQAEQEWLQTFNEVHSRSELEPIRLRPAQAGENPYQRLEALATESVDGDPVTVVMSAFRPDADLRLAVRGVLQQSWRNIELLIVDDGSPPGSEALLEEVESMDHRVRVVRRERNQGTYEARNLAMSVARGRWMTFQDSDDWTHPRRVERQVRHLQESPSVLANRTRTLRAYPDMTMTFPGYAPERVNSSSLLFDLREVAKVVGEFDSTRKAGDTEFPERLLAVRPGSVRDLTHPAPLAITQLRAGSLSRNQMLPGWSRWDRLAYRDSYRE